MRLLQRTLRPLAQYGIEQEHDRVYEALKVSTAFAIEVCPSHREFFRKLQRR